MKITIPTTVRELIEKLQSFPAEAVINLRNDETGEKFYMYSLDAVNDELIIINIEEDIEEEHDDE